MLVLGLGLTGVIRPQERVVADLVLLDGRIWTGSSRAGRVVEAEAVACLNGRILSVGKTSHIRRLVGARTRVIELRGRRVVPGFNDAHVHFADGGQGLAGVELRDANSEADFRDRIGRHAGTLAGGRWIVRPRG